MIKFKVTFRRKCGYTRSGIHKCQTKSFDNKEERDKYVEMLKRNEKFYQIESVFEGEDKVKAIPTTTCQICGRAIQSKNGVIAHHGYRRPYQSHYQTASCDGARFRPFERFIFYKECYR